MNLLAIETSSNACSVAVSHGDDVVDRHVVEPREHTRILLPMIREVLDAAELTTADLDYVVLGNGPGSFIGMRIGASVAQGIAYAAGIEIIPVSSLEAVALEAFASCEARQVIVAQDARMSEVYIGRYAPGEHGYPTALVSEQIVAVGPVVGDRDGTFAAGAAWHDIPALYDANCSALVARLDIREPRARFLLELAPDRADLAVPAERLVPAYLRHKVADSPANPG
jgi:tRNA threonylcarbamoyladenosine biosynthesis protein TsaB